MEHDDARDPDRHPDDTTPIDPTPTDIPDAPAEVPPFDAPDAAAVEMPADAPVAPDAAAGSTWPQRDLAAHADPTTEEPWPEHVEPAAEPPAAWPTADAAPTSDVPTADLSDTAPYDAAASGPPPSEAEAFDAGAVAATGAPEAAAHVVPATNVSESTRCPRCGTENRPGLAFCSNCGQRLVAAGASATVERPGTPEGTRACPRCGTHNRADVAFCQNCGANLRATAAPTGYVPPAVAAQDGAAVAAQGAARRGAILGPVVLLIGAIGIAVGWLLPFPYGGGSLFERAFGAGGYGAAFWNGGSAVKATLVDQTYFFFAGATPVFVALLVVLAIAGFVRAVPGSLQRIGLGLSVVWALGLVVLFLVAELVASWNGDIVGLLRDLSPGGIIFFLASLIVLIGTLTRFAKS